MKQFASLCLSFLFGILLNPLGISASHAALPTHDSSGEPLPSLAPMLEEVNSAVVNIATYSTQRSYSPLLNDPFFRRFFNIPDPRYQRPQKRQQSAGSGVIVDAEEGTVITNYHVIKGSDEVQVSLIDGRTFTANVLGSDPELDIAVLDIDADDLTAVKLAGADDLKVGDFVIAIGNPFGLGQTVTTGIVSALGRSGLGIEGYENFIQTDASINPGNSGGALVNLRGELVGINTAIFSPAGGNIGIGFAIPVGMTRFSAEQILDFGEVRRGELGITGLQEMTTNLRNAFNLRANQHGVVVTGVGADSPAAKSGLEAGDIIVAINGQATLSSNHYRSQVGNVAIGEKVEVEYIRNGRDYRANVEIVAPQRVELTALEGAKLQPASDGNGLIVAEIPNNSRAAYSRLRPGDVILEVNNIAINTVKEFNKALRVDSRQTVLLVSRRGGYFYLVI